MAIGGGTGTDPDPTPSPTPSQSTPPPGPGACTASYAVVGQWEGGFQAEVTVTAGGSGINGWRVSWTFPSGQTVQQSWNADVNSSGTVVTADDVSWNGALPAGGSTAFGFVGSCTSANNPPTLTCAPR